MNNVEIYHNYSIKKYTKEYTGSFTWYSRDYSYVVYLYILFLKVLRKLIHIKQKLLKKKIYKYTVLKKYYEYQVKGLVYLSVYFIFRNIQRIYKVFSLAEISDKNLDTILRRKIYR